MANNEKKSLTKEDIDRLLEKIPSSGFATNSASVFRSGVSKLLGGNGSNSNNDLSSTSEWARVNNAAVSTGPSIGASSATSNSASSSSSSAPTISAAETSLYRIDDQQKDLDKRRAALRQSYAQGKYDLGTKEGRDNYRRDTMFTGFGTWKGQKSPMALLRRADRELKRGNKAQAQHWLDMHDELYGNKTRDKRMALDLEALDEEQKRLDKRREEATRSMLAQKDEDLANKRLALQKEAADREEKYQEWARDFRLAEFGKDQRQFAAKLKASQDADATEQARDMADSLGKTLRELAKKNRKSRERFNKAREEASENLKKANQNLLVSKAALEKVRKDQGDDIVELAKYYNSLDNMYEAEDVVRDLRNQATARSLAASANPLSRESLLRTIEIARRAGRAAGAERDEIQKKRDEERKSRRNFS